MTSLNLGLIRGCGCNRTIDNSDPATSVTLSSAGGTETLVADGTGPTLVVKGLTAGAGVTLTPTGSDITISAGNVASFETSLSGLTPAVPTTGAVVLAGTLGAGSGGTGQTTYAPGDTLYATGLTTMAKLAIGTAGQIMTVSGGLPSWTSSSAALLSIGTILTSMLTEVQFQSLNGVDWILMDGRNVIGSAYSFFTGFPTVPDARGTVLRGKNNGRVDGNQNPAGDLVLGTFENDQFQGHWHQNDPNADGGGEGFAGGGNLGNGLNVTTFATTIITDGVNGAPRFGAETRAKSIAINYFIKIN